VSLRTLTNTPGRVTVANNVLLSDRQHVVGAGLAGFATFPAFTASKHGVAGLTKTAALEYAEQGIRVNAVCPGVIDTEMVERFTGGQPEAEAAMIATEPVGRLGRPAEIADAVVWLAVDFNQSMSPSARARATASPRL